MKEILLDYHGVSVYSEDGILHEVLGEEHFYLPDNYETRKDALKEARREIKEGIERWEKRQNIQNKSESMLLVDVLNLLFVSGCTIYVHYITDPEQPIYSGKPEEVPEELFSLRVMSICGTKRCYNRSTDGNSLCLCVWYATATD